MLLMDTINTPVLNKIKPIITLILRLATIRFGHYLHTTKSEKYYKKLKFLLECSNEYNLSVPVDLHKE